jgi:release factor glutamine methyltransferase
MGLRFVVDRRVLIPRPETEELVAHALDFVRSRGLGSAGILDIGTGSGNVAVALAKSLPSATVVSVDVSRDCLDVALMNARNLGVTNVSFLECDIRDDILPGRRFDLVVANPPYVALHEYEHLQKEVRAYEPRGALTDGGDGLLFVRRTAQLAAAHLAPGGALFMEIAYNQDGVARAIASASGLRNVAVRKDFAGNFRFLTGTLEVA